MSWPLRNDTQIFGNLMATSVKCLEVGGSVKKASKTNSQILPLTVVSCHSQELSSLLDGAALSGSDRSAHLNALKMNCYALTRLLESFENVTSRTSLIDLDVGGKVIGNSWPVICEE